MLIMVAGLLLAMRYQKQNRDRLVDLDALVRGFTLGSDGTPNHPSYTPGGRLLGPGTNTPSSMYHNAAFQQRAREGDTSGYLAGPDSRGPSSAGTGGPLTGPSGGTGGASGDRPPRSFGAMSGLGHRDSPPARRTIRPPAPGHVPLHVPLHDEDPSIQSTRQRGPQREIVLGPRPLAEARSASSGSQEGSMRILEAFGSISEILPSLGNRLRRSFGSTRSSSYKSRASESVHVPHASAKRSTRVSAVVYAGSASTNEHNTNCAGTASSHDTAVSSAAALDTESFRIVDEVLKRGEVDGDEATPACGAAELDTSRFASVTMRSAPVGDLHCSVAMGTVEGIGHATMSSFTGVTASSSGLLSPGGCSVAPDGAARDGTSADRVSTSGTGVEEVETPDITEGNDEEQTQEVETQDDIDPEVGRSWGGARMRKEGSSAMDSVLRKVTENSSQISSGVPVHVDSIQHQMWATIGSSALTTALMGGNTAQIGDTSALQAKYGSSMERAGTDAPGFAESVMEETGRISGSESGADGERVEDESARCISSMIQVDTPSPLEREDMFAATYLDATDELLSSSELFNTPRRAQHNVPRPGRGTLRHSVHARCSRNAALDSGMQFVQTSNNSPGCTVSSGAMPEATISSRVKPDAAGDKSSSSMLGSLQSSSFDVIKRIQMMLTPGWRSHEDDSRCNPVAEEAQAAPPGETSSCSGVYAHVPSASLVNFPSLQLLQLPGCQDSQFDTVDTVEQFV